MTPGTDLVPPPEEPTTLKTYELRLKDGSEPIFLQAASCVTEGGDYIFYDADHHVLTSYASSAVDSVDIA